MKGIMEFKELIKYLKEKQDTVFVFELKGIVSTIISIENVNIRTDSLFLTIENNKNNMEKIILDLHQLIRFNIIEERKVLLEFDQLQKIIIEIV